MTNALPIRLAFVCFLAWSIFSPVGALADTACSKLIVFGDSLSDPGNAFALTGQKSVPPYANLDPFLVPDAPYAKGGLHFSNGATWVEQFAQTLGANQSTGPAFRVPGVFCNFAVGGARAGGLSPIDLSGQVTDFLGSRVVSEPLDGALGVIVIGGNDVRDALAVFNPADPSQALGIISNAVAHIVDGINALHQVGVNKFLVGNVPNLALTPAVTKLNTLNPGAAGAAFFLSTQFNASLVSALGGLNEEIILFNLFDTISEVAIDPAAFGLTNVDTACVMPNEPPFACRKPDAFAFWDGIHPTKALHAILANAASAALASAP
jgi:phospholipase/lecithinase/hemolysin